MNELSKWQLINSCDSVKELENAFDLIFTDSVVAGKKQNHNKELMRMNIKHVVSGDAPASALTREYGLRQQAIYLQYYN